MTRLAWPATLLALAVGIAFSTWMFTAAGVFPAHPLADASSADNAAYVIGQRYFIRDAWRWPLLVVPRLGTPDGVNIALTDSIPLVALVLKLLRGWLPDGFTFTDGWVAICFALQPAASVFALRSAGERRLLPALAISVIALSMPTLLRRLGHDALCSHFILLVAIGLYFRITSATARHWWIAVPLLLLTALLIHPYLMAMSAAVLAAAPLTLLLRRDRAWRSVALVVAFSYALTFGAMTVLGYTGVQAAPGFGYYSMNLLSPITPAHSWLIGAADLDATGGQSVEGYQYLGLGVIGIGALALASQVRAARGLGHAGLVLVCLGLFAYALSNKVYAGDTLLLTIQHVPPVVEQLRASGRFFWPVAYVIAVTSVAGLGQRLRAAWLIPILLLAAALQFADATRLRMNDYGREHFPDTWTIPRDALAPAFSAASRLTLWPTFGCGATVEQGSPFMQLLLLASAANLATNTMYAARTHAEPACDPAAVLGKPWQPGELRIILPAAGAGPRWLVPDFDRLCRAVDGLVVCSQETAALAGLPPLAIPPVPVGTWLTVADPVLLDSLVIGWQASQDSAWSIGPVARIAARLAPSGVHPARVSIRVLGLAPVAGGVQHVTLEADGQALAAWDLPDETEMTLDADLPAGASDRLELVFDIDHPVRPVDRGINADSRPLGLLLRGLRVD